MTGVSANLHLLRLSFLPEGSTTVSSLDIMTGVLLTTLRSRGANTSSSKLVSTRGRMQKGRCCGGGGGGGEWLGEHEKKVARYRALWINQDSPSYRRVLSR